MRSPRRPLRPPGLGPILAALVIATSWLTAAPSVNAAAPEICPARFSLMQTVALTVPICSSQPLGEPSSEVRRLIVVIHGDSRNAVDHLRYVQRAAELSGVTDALIVAPQFLTAGDLLAARLSNDVLYWASDTWKRGAASARTPLARRWSMPAFRVIDRLVEHLVTGPDYPQLASVVIVGHSAGGQFTNRYAAFHRLASSVLEQVTMRFVVANPSTYVYLDDRRYDPSTQDVRSLTSNERSACPRFDTYRHGLAGIGPYREAIMAPTIRSRYASRTVTYLLGSLDTDRADPQLDTSCAAAWQGQDRLERGLHYERSLRLIFGTSISQRHRFATVVGIGHDASGMYRSVAGRAALFD